MREEAVLEPDVAEGHGEEDDDGEEGVDKVLLPEVPLLEFRQNVTKLLKFLCLA